MASSALADVKVASVDITKLYTMFHKRVQTENSLKAEIEKINKELVERQEKLKQMDEELKKINAQYDPTLSEAAVKKLRERAASATNRLKAEAEEYKTFEQRRQVAFEEMRRRALAILNKELRETVGVVAAEGKYDLVVDAGSTPYVNPELDITPLVLKRLNADAPEGFDAQAEYDRVTGQAAQLPTAESAE